MARLGRSFPTYAAKFITPFPRVPSIQFDAAGSANSVATASLAWTHVVGAGANRLLVVDVGLVNALGQRVTGVTYGAQNLVFLGEVANGSAVRSERWFLVAPTSGSATVTVTLSASAGCAGGSTSWTGVDQQVEPFSGFNVGTGTGTSISTTEPSGSDYLVLDTVASATTGATPGTGQVQRYSDGLASLTVEGSSTAGQTSTVMSWTAGLSAAWAQITTSFVPAYVTVSNTPSGTDTGSGTDATTTLVASVAHSDTGSGTESEQADVVILSSETISGTDTGLIASSLTHAETGVGTEESPIVGLLSQEVASGADTGTELSTATTTEVGAGSEGSPVVGLSATDVNTAITEGTPEVAIGSTDLGGSSEANLDVAASSIDVGSGNETSNTLVVVVTSSDTGHGAEGTPQSSLSSSDTSNPAFERGWDIRLAASDTASGGTEGTPAIATVILASEVASGADGNLITVTASYGDMGQAIESGWSPAAAVTQGETLAGAEGGGIGLNTADSTSGTEAVQPINFAYTDAASSGEGVLVGALVGSTDAVSSIEANGVSNASSDSGSGADTYDVVGVHPATEIGHGADLQTLGIVSNIDARGQATTTRRPTLIEGGSL